MPASLTGLDLAPTLAAVPAHSVTHAITHTVSATITVSALAQTAVVGALFGFFGFLLSWLALGGAESAARARDAHPWLRKARYPGLALGTIAMASIGFLLSFDGATSKTDDLKTLAAALDVEPAAIGILPRIGEPFAVEIDGVLNLCRAADAYDQVECVDPDSWGPVDRVGSETEPVELSTPAEEASGQRASDAQAADND